MEKNACTTTCNNTIGKCFNTILDTYTTYNMSNSYYTKGLFILAWSTGLARFPRSRLATLFFVKILMCSYERPSWPGYRDLGCFNHDLGDRDESFPI